nr:hypothetical protein [Megavirus caiporensis]
MRVNREEPSQQLVENETCEIPCLQTFFEEFLRQSAVWVDKCNCWGNAENETHGTCRPSIGTRWVTWR